MRPPIVSFAGLARESALCVSKRLKQPDFLRKVTLRSRVQLDSAYPIMRKVLRALAPTRIEIVGPNVVKNMLCTLGSFHKGAQLASIISEQAFGHDDIAELHFFSPPGANADHCHASRFENSNEPGRGIRRELRAHVGSASNRPTQTAWITPRKVNEPAGVTVLVPTLLALQHDILLVLHRCYDEDVCQLYLWRCWIGHQRQSVRPTFYQGFLLVQNAA
jgi:hypothetical protein